jgi:hypothetical protein
LESNTPNKETSPYKECLKSKREAQVKYFVHHNLINENPTEEQLRALEDTKEQYVIALSLDPTMEEINNLPSEVDKGTELETVLMQLKVLTME